MKHNNSKSAPEWGDWFIIALIIAILILIGWALTQGEISLISRSEIQAALRKEHEELEERHRILEEIIKSKEAERDRLIRLCERVYILFKVFLFCIVALVYAVLALFGILEYSMQTFMAFMSIVGFLSLGGFILLKDLWSLKEGSAFIKRNFEDFIYGQYVDEIAMHRLELSELKEKLQNVRQQLKE